MQDKRTVQQAISEHDYTIVLAFGAKKWFQAPWSSTEKFCTDEHGRIEIDLDSYIAQEADVDEDTTVEQAFEKIYNYLLKNETTPPEGYYQEA